jgi:neutral ceramidase
MNALRAGAGRSEIEYPAGTWPLDGFTGVHDPLFVRVLILESTERIVLAVLDQTSLSPSPLAVVRERLAGIADVDQRSVIVSVSHTFSAPHLSDAAAGSDRMRSAMEAVLAAVDDAATAAVEALGSAAIGAGTGVCDINVNRDVETADGWTLGASEDGFSDKTVVVVRVDGSDGRPIALLVNSAVQPSVMNESVAEGGRPVTADLAGAAMAALERTSPGVVAMFLIGAAGDQAPALTSVRKALGPAGEWVRRDAGAGGFAVAELLGERLAGAARTIADAIADFDATPLIELSSGELGALGQQPTAREHIRPTRAHDFVPTGPQGLPYWILRVGATALVGVRPELSATTGRRIRGRSPFAHTVVATLVNGGAKYLPDESAYDRLTYEALSSSYVRGTAEQLADVLAERLDREHAAPPIATFAP